MKLQTADKPLDKIVQSEIKAIVVDIEGTTTPITFVSKTLFPYIKENVESYLEKNWDSKEAKDDVEALRTLAESDKSEGIENVPLILSENKKDVLDSVVKNVLWQMSKDRKSTALKQLQGHMWRSAYEDESIKGEIYDDVPIALKSLKDYGKKLYVYSSGSVEAQKLIFKHSDKGNLTHLFSDYFDTKVGAKREASSYSKISKSIGENPQNILFLTDVVAEAEAAEEATMRTCILLRPGNKVIPEDDLKKFTAIRSFSELLSDTEDIPLKRQKI